MNFAIIVSALGYFVDVYDLILFSVVRLSSLRDLGVPEDKLLPVGLYLLNMQMGGMLIGGILWGVWGDKRGRISVLFGSIFLYSAANIANGFVTSVEQYALLRLLAGIGLAGELGAGITLVSELMTKETRSYGTTIVATFGVAGAVAASLIAQKFHWRTSYYIGGGLGLALLVLRVSVYESGLFEQVKASTAKRGDLLLLLRSRERFWRYLRCIIIGLPVWYVVGILVTLSPEIGKALEMPSAPVAGKAVLYTYIGLVLGDLASGLMSQVMKSRRKVLGMFLLLSAIFSLALLNARGITPFYFYALCVPLGFGVGYWAVFVTTAAEQFGTNLRATVTTTVPNFVRGAVVPLTSLFDALRGPCGVIPSAHLVGALSFILALLALSRMQESFSRDLDFVEE